MSSQGITLFLGIMLIIHSVMQCLGDFDELS